MDIKTLDHLAQLSKLSFSETEKDQLIHEMGNIIALMDTIKSFNITYDDTKDGGEVTLSDLREDVAKPSYEPEKLLSNTNPISDCYVIPRMME